MNKPTNTLFTIVLSLVIFLGLTTILYAADPPSSAETEKSPAGEANAASQNTPLVDEQKDLLSQIYDDKEHLAEMRKGMKGLSGEQQIALGMQIREAGTQLRNKLGTLIDLINKQREQGDGNTETMEHASALIAEESKIIRGEIKYIGDYINDLRKNQAELDPLQLLARKQEIGKNLLIYDGLLSDLLENADRLKHVGLSSEEDLVFLDELLKKRSTTVSGVIKLMSSKIDDLKKQVPKVSEDEKVKIQTRIEAIEEDKSGATTSLKHLVSLMHKRDIDATEYSELLINETGQISSEILDADVVFSLFQHWLVYIENWLSDNGIAVIVKIIFVALILLLFKLLSGITKRVVRKAMGGEASNISRLMGNFFVTMSGKLVMLIGLMVALSQLGIKIAPMLAGLGIAGFVVAFALQDVLSNFASGVMILIYQPFDVGDTIEVPEVSGKVQHMNLVSTIILTYDNQKLVVPNNKIWGNIIRNIHAEHIRRVDLVFGIGYQDDISHAERVLREIVEEHKLVLKTPEATIKLHALSESSVDFIVRPWTNTNNYWDVHWDITRSVKERFDSEGISIPYPQRDIHLQYPPPTLAHQTEK